MCDVASNTHLPDTSQLTQVASERTCFPQLLSEAHSSHQGRSPDLITHELCLDSSQAALKRQRHEKQRRISERLQRQSSTEILAVPIAHVANRAQSAPPLSMANALRFSGEVAQLHKEALSLQQQCMREFVQNNLLAFTQHFADPAASDVMDSTHDSGW